MQTIAPFTGARIEIDYNFKNKSYNTIAPFTGARIEIALQGGRGKASASHPSRVRGLKYRLQLDWHKDVYIAPFTGARIEMT